MNDKDSSFSCNFGFMIYKNIAFICSFVIVLYFSACSTDFDVNADWQENTIVYGLLDQTKDVQYIRINKAFLDKNTGALEVAAIPDSLYFKNALVSLEEYANYTVNEEDGSIAVQGNVVRTYTFEKVNAADEGLSKEAGIFANEPFFLYKTNTAGADSLVGTHAYKLKIITDGGNLIEAVTPLAYVPQTPGQTFRYLIHQPKTSTSLNLTLPTGTNPDRKIAIEFNPANNGAIYDLILDIVYSETLIADPTQIKTDTLQWVLFKSQQKEEFPAATSSGTRRQYTQLTTEDFMNYIAASMQPNEAVYRQLKAMNFTMYTATNNVKNFQDIALAAQSSLNGGDFKPNYTNVSNGYGLFGSRYSETVSVTAFEAAGLDEIACGSITGGLNFAPSPGSIYFPYCP